MPYPRPQERKVRSGPREVDGTGSSVAAGVEHCSSATLRALVVTAGADADVGAGADVVVGTDVAGRHSSSVPSRLRLGSVG